MALDLQVGPHEKPCVLVIPTSVCATSFGYAPRLCSIEAGVRPHSWFRFGTIREAKCQGQHYTATVSPGGVRAPIDGRATPGEGGGKLLKLIPYDRRHDAASTLKTHARLDASCADQCCALPRPGA